MFWKSKGIGRALGILLISVGHYGQAIPQIAPYSSLLITIGTALGGASVVNAALGSR